jgi:hypothetical protein
MIVAEAVLETSGLTEFTAWPTAAPPSDHLLVLSGQMSQAEVGTAVAVIFEYADIPAVPVDDLHHLLDQHLSEAEELVAPGGLRFRDTITGAAVVPGCCFGLESWREWREVLHGKSIWLGHSPGTHLEHRDGAIQLWQDRHDKLIPPALQIKITDLPDLLLSVQRQLQGFLDLVHRWANEISPAAATRLVAVLDENLKINKGLRLKD